MLDELPVGLVTQAYADRDEDGRWDISFDDPDSDLAVFTCLDLGIASVSTPFEIDGVDAALASVGLKFAFGPTWYEDPWGCGGWYASVTPLV